MKLTPRLEILDKQQPIAVLVSGGVDSSVALARLKKLGFSNLRAFYLKIWLEDELAHLGACPWEEDLKFVQAVCEKVSVPLEVVPMQHQYWNRVVAYTVNELKQGYTPSPDLMCNTFIKFGAFLEYIQANPPFSRDFLIATGHYAETLIDRERGEIFLGRSPDPVKDQTYFLSLLSPEQLRRCLFPLGDLKKQEVRQLAKEFGLLNQDRKDSQGICFLGKIPYAEFVRLQVGVKPGLIREDQSGKVLGQHQGTWFHTIGQRKGLGLGGGPWYVVRKDIAKNEVIVAHPEQRIQENHRQFIVEYQPWMANLSPNTGLRVKVRHGPNDLEILNFASDGQTAMVSLAQADFGIASGQFAVFYQGKLCLGGSRIVADPMTMVHTPKLTAVATEEKTAEKTTEKGEVPCLTSFTKSSTSSASASLSPH